MAIKMATFASSAWTALRMALLWARKGGAFKSAVHKRIIKANNKAHSDRMHCLERQFSIDETPAFHFKMHRPASLRWISCVNPPVDFDERDDERNYFKWEKQSEDSQDQEEAEEKCIINNDDGELICRVEEIEREEEIDWKAEEFIAKFYDQMKMQRQISFLQYNEMLERSMS